MGNRNVVIVDYGLGNLHSVNKAVALVGGNPVITGDKEIIAAAEKLILPGVGAFSDCMANLCTPRRHTKSDALKLFLRTSATPRTVLSDRKSTRLNSSHPTTSRMPSSA